MPSSASPTWRPAWSRPRRPRAASCRPTSGGTPSCRPTGTETTGYPTQKPEGVLRRIVQASSAPGDLVGDFFAGRARWAPSPSARPPLRARRQQPRGGRGHGAAAGRDAHAEHSDAAGAGRRAARRDAEEEPVGDHAGHRGTAAARPSGSPQSSRRQSRIAVALVGDERPPPAPSRSVQLPADPLSSRSQTGSANATTSTGSGRPLAQPSTSLRLVADDHDQPAGAGDHLLAQLRAAQALDQVEAGVDLVGAVDRRRRAAGARPRSASGIPRRRQRSAVASRRGHAGDVAQAAVGQPLGQRRRASTPRSTPVPRPSSIPSRT